MKRFNLNLKSLTLVTMIFMAGNAQAQNGFRRPVMFAPFPSQLSDMTYSMSTRGGKKSPFNSNPEEYRVVGVYKVKGNSMLLKGFNATDVFMKDGYARNVSTAYDAYNQNFGVLLEQNTKLLNISFKELDSFRVNVDSAGELKVPTVFVNASILDKSKKFFVERLVTGKYGLFKSYKSEMIPASEDIAQTNLQKFEMRNDFYYSTGTGYKKIKPNLGVLKEVFKNDQHVLNILNKTTDINTEAQLTELFYKING